MTAELSAEMPSSANLVKKSLVVEIKVDASTAALMASVVKEDVSLDVWDQAPMIFMVALLVDNLEKPSIPHLLHLLT